MDSAYGYCGMPCALCSRHRTNGKSRCPGCSMDGYYTDVCGVYRCCREKGLRHCGECKDYPCLRLGKMSDFRDLNTNGAKRLNCEYIAGQGFEAWYAEHNERAALLSEALIKYNNGRMKRYLCELFIQRDIQYLRKLMVQARDISDSPKQAGAAFQALADRLTLNNNVEES